MPKIFLTLFLAFIFPQLAAAATHSLDDGTTGQAETYTYTNFIGTTNLTVDAKPNDWAPLIFVDVSKNAGRGLGVLNQNFLNGYQDSPALEHAESLIFNFSEAVLLAGFTITPGDQPAHYFDVTNAEDDTDINFTIDSGTGLVRFSEGPMSLLSLAITGLVNCTGFFVESLETPSAVPLPAALPLYAAGMGVLGFLGWRKKRKLSS